MIFLRVLPKIFLWPHYSGAPGHRGSRFIETPEPAVATPLFIRTIPYLRVAEAKELGEGVADVCQTQQHERNADHGVRNAHDPTPERLGCDVAVALQTHRHAYIRDSSAWEERTVDPEKYSTLHDGIAPNLVCATAREWRTYQTFVSHKPQASKQVYWPKTILCQY